MTLHYDVHWHPSNIKLMRGLHFSLHWSWSELGLTVAGGAHNLTMQWMIVINTGAFPNESVQIRRLDLDSSFIRLHAAGLLRIYNKQAN